MESRYPTTGRILALTDGEVKKLKAEVAQHYEPKLYFDPTPVYSVTLAEDTMATIGSPYVIDLSEAASKDLWIVIEANPGANTKYCTYTAICSDNTTLTYYTQTVDTGNRIINVHAKIENGLLTIGGRAAAILNTIGTMGYRTINAFPVVADGVYISTLNFAITSGEPFAFPAGTKISVYAAKKV